MDKFEKAQKILKEINADGWLIICNEDSDINSRFLLGVGSHARHYIYVAADGNHKVLSVEMEAAMIKRSLKERNIKCEVNFYRSLKQLKKLLSPIVNKSRIALNFGENVLNEDGTSQADYIHAGDYFSVKDLAPKTEFISAAPIIYELRSIKSSEELKDLRNVCKATLEILETVPEFVKVGMTEKEVKTKIEYDYMKLGKTAFETIVGTGPHSSDPHHNTSNKKIEPGVLLIDTGLQIDEMCSDITWTYWVGKNPADKFLQAYKVLYDSKKIANEYFIDGSPNHLPARKCREYLAEKGYDHEKLFFHGLGHSLGFEAHDIGARINRNIPEMYSLKENMVYTNEPGLYWKSKWGIRLEDDVIIGKTKCEQVTYNHEDPILI
ncbi:MAG: M24 family metallopeptidase [Promethearchaeota archaeon]|jgi:Xaa-Pro aminopeptidase